MLRRAGFRANEYLELFSVTSGADPNLSGLANCGGRRNEARRGEDAIEAETLKNGSVFLLKYSQQFSRHKTDSGYLLDGLSPLIFEPNDENDLNVDDPEEPNNGVAVKYKNNKSDEYNC